MNKSKILVIDDDPSIVKLLEKWLDVAGKDVISSKTGEDGIKKAIEYKPNLILLDIMLPGIGGTDTARKLSHNPSTHDIPIIFMTSCMGVENDKGDETIIVDDMEYRAFAKPLHNMKLLSEIRKTINRVKHNT